MPADMAEDSAELLKTLTEDRSTLEKQIGCLAGLLQIFDRQRSLTGRRYGSNRTSTANEDAASTACRTDVLHEPGSPSAYHKFEGQQPGSKVSFYEEDKGSASVQERVSINKDEVTPSRLSSDFVNQPSRISENERPRRETPGHSTVEHKSPVTPAAQRRMSVDGSLSFENFSRSPDSSLIRNIVINSLHKEKPRVSVDNSNREVMAGLIRLKNLARSRSVGGRNGYSRTSAEFPRSSSLSAQRSSGMYKDGHEAICEEDAPELLARERIASNLTHLRRSLNGSETLRLTVKLEEGPGVGTKKLLQINSHNYERDAARQPAMSLNKSLGALDLKESFRALQKEKSIRRSFVDGEQTSPADVSVMLRPCVDGRRSPPRELQSSRDEQEGRRGGSNVVARLMGLEEFSSPPTLRKDYKDEGSMDANGHGQQRRGRSLSPKHRLMDGMPSPMRHQEAREALKSRLTKSMKHFYEEGPLQTSQGCKTPSPTLEPLHGDIIQRLQQLRSRNSVEERETLNQILETLQLKGLLHSPQRKSSATPEYVRQRFATTKDSSEQSCREPLTGHKMKHEATIMVLKPTQKDAHCKSNRSECSERSEATTGTRFSNEDGGSTKPGRGKSRSPVRSSKAPLRVNDDARSTYQVSAHPIAVASTKLRSNSSTSCSSNARSPHVKQLLQDQAFSHLRDKKESKAALVTVRGTQSPGVLLKNDPVSDAKRDETTKNCEAQIVKSSAEVMRQKRPSRITSRDTPSLVPRPSSPGRDFEDRSSTTSEIIVDKKKPTSEGDSPAATQTSSDHDSCVDRQTMNNTPAKIREILQSLKVQQLPSKDFSDVKESSEVMTPRAGFPVEKVIHALEKSRQGSEGCEQRSPVSVLDNSVFEEDGSPCPMVAVNLQDSYESNEHDHQCHEVRPKNASELATTSLTSVDTESDMNATSASSRDKERDFVDELLMLSGITKHANWASWTFSSRIKHSDINPRFLLDLKGDLQRASFEASADVFYNKCDKQEQGKQMDMLDRRALIDFVYELLAIKVAEYENAQPWLESTWIGAGQEFKRQNLVNAIWKELQEFPCAASDDICDTVQGILQEDLGSRGPKWTDFRAEIGEVGVEVEKLIYRDLMEEVVKDLKCSSSSRYLAKLLEGSSGPRRQLFAL